jgi:hypothetical protein
MKQFYSKFTAEKFKVFTIITLFLLDLFNSAHLYSRINDYEQFMKVLNTSLEITLGEGTHQLPPDYLQNVFDMMMQLAIMSILLYLLLHLIIYFCYYRNVMFGYYYIKIMTWCASVVTFIMALGFTSNASLAVYFVVAPIYLFIAYGLGLFPTLKKNEER